MESQDKEKEYEDNVWEIYHKEWATASGEKRIELNNRMRRWQELVKNGWTPSQAYIRVMEEESDTPQRLIPSAKKAKTKTTRYLLLTLASVLVLAISLVIFAQSSAPTLEPAPTSVQQSEPPPETVENSRYIYEDGAIHVGADEKPIELINNPAATNPTYAELVAFIKEDTTDSKVYSEGVEWRGKIIFPRVCADFAEEVHNNAEAKGIRAAWVGIDFRGGGEGHALNAFETIDRGLVYVDCTGAGLGERLRQILEASSSHTATPKPTSQDSIAYVEIGKEYGRIDIAKAKSPSYSFYDEYKQKWQESDMLLSEYNEEVVQYNQEIEGKVYYEGSPELARIEAWEARIEEKKRVIVKLAEELGDFWFEPLGIVEDIYIHW